MLNALLTKVAGLFDKDFLFAAFLPSLLFWSAVGGTFVFISGVDGAFAWIDSWGALKKAAIGAAVSLFIVVFGYVLVALRQSFLRLWSGTSESPFLEAPYRLGEWRQKRRFNQLELRANRISPWEDTFQAFRLAVTQHWHGQGPLIDHATFSRLMKTVSSLDRTISTDTITVRLKPVIDAFQSHSGNGLLLDVYKAINDKFDRWNNAERSDIQNTAFKLDRSFGSFATVKATDLGNIIEAYHAYAYKRYRIESEVFWPRLRRVITTDYLAVIQEPRILLDFCLAMSTLALIYCGLAIVVGPWLWYSLPVWFALAFASAGVGAFFYQMSVRAAKELGEWIRSSFDLFRLDMLEALQFDRPTTLSAEIVQWQRISQLVVFGDESDFPIRRKS